MTPATPAPLVCPYCGRERSVSDVALRRTKCRGCGGPFSIVKRRRILLGYRYPDVITFSVSGAYDTTKLYTFWK